MSSSNSRWRPSLRKLPVTWPSPVRHADHYDFSACRKRGAPATTTARTTFGQVHGRACDPLIFFEKEVLGKGFEPMRAEHSD